MSGVKWFLRKSGSDTDVTVSFYPTFNDMMGLGESDTDSDMPHLADAILHGDGGDDSDSDLPDDISVGGLQELVGETCRFSGT